VTKYGINNTILLLIDVAYTFLLFSPCLLIFRFNLGLSSRIMPTVNWQPRPPAEADCESSNCKCPMVTIWTDKQMDSQFAASLAACQPGCCCCMTSGGGSSSSPCYYANYFSLLGTDGRPKQSGFIAAVEGASLRT
jgi:hypothetical protein